MTYIHTHTHLHTHTLTHTHTYTYLHMLSHTHRSLLQSQYFFFCILAHTHTYRHTHTNRHTHTYRHTHTHILTHTHRSLLQSQYFFFCICEACTSQEQTGSDCIMTGIRCANRGCTGWVCGNNAGTCIHSKSKTQGVCKTCGTVLDVRGMDKVERALGKWEDLQIRVQNMMHAGNKNVCLIVCMFICLFVCLCVCMFFFFDHDACR